MLRGGKDAGPFPAEGSPVEKGDPFRHNYWLVILRRPGANGDEFVARKGEIRFLFRGSVDERVSEEMKTLRLWPILFLILLALLRTHAAALPKPFHFQHVTQKDGLSSDMVNCIAVHGEEVWFGTYGGGATLFHKAKNSWKAFTTKGEPMDKEDDGNSIHWKNLLPYNHVSVIVPDRDRIWFGTYFYGFGGGGISYYAPSKTVPWKRFNTHGGKAKKVVSMAVDNESVWVGSEKGLSLLDKKTEGWRAFYSMENGLPGNFVNAIVVASDGLWIATNVGVSRLNKDRKVWRHYSQNEGLPETEIRSLAKVGQTLWAGGSMGTLAQYDRATDRWKRLEPTDPLKHGAIHAIGATRERVLICRENGLSIYELATATWESLTASDGLLSNTVFFAAEDGESIWIATDKGASRLFWKR